MNEKHYYTLDRFYKEKFGCKVFKVSLDAGFTCPNKDGKKGTGGCIFCSKTPYIGDSNKTLFEQFEEVKTMLHKKWKNAKYIVYLEANSNTYASVEKLKSIYEPLIKLKNVVGLNIGTRCDCLTDEILDYLEELNTRTYLTVELGLQSSFNETLEYLNRRHTKEDFENAVKNLKDRGINVVVHIINGLPGETKKMMIETIKYVNSLHIDGIKIHMLYIEEDTELAKIFKEKEFKLLSKDEYIEIVTQQLQELSKNIVIHRITSDPDKNKLIAPDWLVKKFVVLNDIDKYMKKYNIYQGDLITTNMDNIDL